MRSGPTFAFLALAAASSACVSVELRRESRFSPVSMERVESLVPGESDLANCLNALGAPLQVWEHDIDGVALSYGWFHARAWKLDVSVPITSDVSASMDYTHANERMRGVVLFFDDRYRLERWRAGLLSELITETRPPAAAVE